MGLNNHPFKHSHQSYKLIRSMNMEGQDNQGFKIENRCKLGQREARLIANCVTPDCTDSSLSWPIGNTVSNCQLLALPPVMSRQHMRSIVSAARRRLERTGFHRPLGQAS